MRTPPVTPSDPTDWNSITYGATHWLPSWLPVALSFLPGPDDPKWKFVASISPRLIKRAEADRARLELELATLKDPTHLSTASDELQLSDSVEVVPVPPLHPLLSLNDKPSRCLPADGEIGSFFCEPSREDGGV